MPRVEVDTAHRFIPFSKRVNDIDVNVFHKVKHRNEEVPDKVETYFYQQVQEENFLNLAENYLNFRKEVSHIVTLPQLLVCKEHVINTLLKYIKLKDPLCLESIFRIVLAVARDLEDNFYPFFPDFLAAIIDLLNVKDADQLEYTFRTLAYLFKYQWRYMIKNVDKIFYLLVPLLAESYPAYINNFAAESFAFVVRKVKDKPAFIQLVIDALEEQQNKVVGCGKLFYHVLAGTLGHFHSCAESMLSIYFDALENTPSKQQLHFQVLTVVFNCITKEIHFQNSEVLWTVILKYLDKFEGNNLKLLLQLTKVIIKNKEEMVKDPAAWVLKLGQLIQKYDHDSELTAEVVNVSIDTLLAIKKLQQESSSFLVIKLLSIEDQKCLIKITQDLIPYSSFETMVLPRVLKKSQFSILNNELLDLFVNIVMLKSPPKLGGIEFEKWNKLNLNIQGKENFTYLANILDTFELHFEIGSVNEDFLKVLYIIPHLSTLPNEIHDAVTKSLINLYKRIQKKENSSDGINFAFLLAMESTLRIASSDKLFDLIQNLSNLLDTLCFYQNDAAILKSLDMLLSYMKNSSYENEYINQSIFDLIHQALASKLGSSNSLIRLTVSHIFSLFASISTMKPATSEENPTKSALELPYLAECQPVTVHQYRQRLVYSQSLNVNSASVIHLEDKYQDIPLHHCFGSLYLNFSLIWEPICQIITSYANPDCKLFWTIFISKLKGINGEKSELDKVLKPSYRNEILNDTVKKVYTSDKIHLDNVRYLLWKCMGMMSVYIEPKNRDYVDIFIEFVEKNFYRAHSEEAKSCSIRIYKKDESNKKLSDEKSFTDKTSTESTRSERVKLLLTMLQVFGKFTNTRSLSREPEISKIYYDFLSSKNLEIQKAALNCIYTYKHKYIVPYQIQLDNIVNEQNLKNELVRFQISVDQTGIQEEHREGLMPILMRILHAKMSQRVGMRTGGKAGGLVKRKTILRFLAGIKEEEMMVFIRMAFKPFQNYLPILKVEKESQSYIKLCAMIKELIPSVDLDNVIPPKRLQSAVNLVSVMIEQFGGKMTKHVLPHLLSILVCILAQTVGILDLVNDVHPDFLKMIKNVRNTGINVLARFFQHFENYDWTSDEIDAVFETAVFPWLNKLPIEGIHSPTPLLKMFDVWSKNPRYYPFFVKLNKNNQTSINSIIELLSNQKTDKSVLKMIIEIIEKLVTTLDFEKEDPEEMDIDDEIKAKSLFDVVTEKLEIIRDDTINYGSAMLLPHVSKILAFMVKKLKEQKKHGANRIELTVLSSISEFATDAETSDTLLTLILPILTKKAGDSEDVVMGFLTTVANLMKRVDKPAIYLRPVQQLLALLTTPQTRNLLMQVLEEVARNNEDLQNSQKLLVELNAYDRRWIEQADYERRLNAFKQIDMLIKDEKVTVDFGVSIILNCYYFFKTENNQAMELRTSECLENISVYLCKKFNNVPIDRKYLVEDTILNLIRNGIKDKRDKVKLQSIAYLGHMATECPDVHVVLRDLHALTNKIDPEVDFFKNMVNLQRHRKGRALLKFCKVAKTLTKAPNARTLSQFILPLASYYLCNEKYTDKEGHNIITAAIETVGTVCRLLPWNQYEFILKYYLFKLRNNIEHQKQVIRIVVAILDSFHFDLSKYKEVNEVIEKHDDKEKDENVEDESNFENVPTQTEDVPSIEDINEVDETEEIEEKESHNCETEMEKVSTVQEIPFVEKQTVLSQYMARRLVQSITGVLLPQLHRSITVRARLDGAHKVNKKRVGAEQEERDLMRVPIALAMVKLLQKLPSNILDANVRGIFMKICTFLKSRLESVRRITREILEEIMITLGPDYLHHLLQEMNTLLTRGFQVHVLAFTIQAVLVKLKPSLEPKHIKANIALLHNVCKIDLFGPSAEEKEISGILKNTSEAKSTKSYDIYKIMSQFTDSDTMVPLIQPLRDILQRTKSLKIIRKATESLRHIAQGLACNTFVPLTELLRFLQGVVYETIPEIMPDDKRKTANEDKKAKTKFLVEDHTLSLLIQPPPKTRMGCKTTSKISKDTNTNLLMEFGLKILSLLLKNEKIKGKIMSDQSLNEQLDEFVPFLSNCLESQHVKLSTLSLRCLCYVMTTDLQNVQKFSKEICKSMFDILHKYAVAGLGKGDNYELVMTAFKAVSILVQDAKHFKPTPEQLETLLIYVEQDIHDHERRATAFKLLKAIIKRKLIVPEMHAVMEEVSKLSVISESEDVRKEARAAYYTYLMDYPLGKDLLFKNISFFMEQLNYSETFGRLSVINMIHDIITSFPPQVLEEYADLMFLSLGARLINDEDSTCQKNCAKCIQELLSRISHNLRSTFFDYICDWMKAKKLTHRRLAVQLCGILVTTEKVNFSSRLDTLLPILSKQFSNNLEEIDEDAPGRFVRNVKSTIVKDRKVKSEKRLKDHHFYLVLQLVLKICKNCPNFLGKGTNETNKYQKYIDIFSDKSQSYLAHPHLWVRFAASQVLGFVLASGDIKNWSAEKLRSVILDSVDQLHPEVDNEEFFDQIIKNLAAMAKFVDIENSETSEKSMSLYWLIKSLRKKINLEITQAPQSILVRTAVFKWIAGVTVHIDIEKLKPMLHHLVSPLVREMMTTEVENAPLRHLAKEVAERFQKILDVDEYTRHFNVARQHLDVKRAEKKAERSRQFVTNPEIANKRKLKRQEKKRKRKSDVKRRTKPKKMRMNDDDDEN